MSTHPEQYIEEAKARVRAQYGAVGDAYVRSVGHASGNDLARMVEVATPTSTDTLLDIATGGGHVARTFAPHVSHVIASDLTPEILQHAAAFFKELGLTNVETRIADAEDLPFADASFDIVTCRIAPHHFPRPDRFVREVARVLRPGGRFVLIDSTVPEGEAGAFFNRFEKLRDPSHARSLTIPEWESLINAAGLALANVESFTKRHDFDDWTARSRMSERDKATLEAMMVDAPAAIRAAHNAETTDGRLEAFTDTKTLFVATRT
ncbi:MAG TPA: class I SAM-dependent methyltransferase [Thermomicrobiales bacterium]|nr:class I SAM-dependent methyltransferase [Thermomicrobiales bacterium]